MASSIVRKTLKGLYHILPFKHFLFKTLRSVYIPKRDIYQHLHFNGWFSIPVKDKSFSMFHYGFQIENELFWKGLNGWEGYSLRAWTKLSEASEVVMDIGANTGIYALLTKSVNPGAEVFAYEPVNRVFDKLQKNIQKNNFQIKAEEIAISDYDGLATIYDQATDHIYSVTVNKNLASANTSVVPTEVKVKKLSTIIEESGIKNIDLIKLDVETHEPEVLRGMGKYLTIFRPILLIEILTDEVAVQVSEIMKGMGYDYYRVDDNSGLVLIEQLEIHKGNAEGYNFLLCPHDKSSIIERIKNTA